MAILISPELLHDLLDVNYETGELTWKKRRLDPRWSQRWTGQPALTAKLSNGSRCGGILGQNYMASRVIWAMYYGEWPTGVIVPIDGNIANLAIANLKEVARGAQGRRK